MASPLEHIAVVGCGFAGTSLLYQLVDRHAAVRISVFETTGDFGPGYAYRAEECADYLINNTTDTMCLTRSSRRAFFDWLETKRAPDASVDGKGHQPRAKYGEFLKEVFNSTLSSAAARGIEVTLVPFEATGIRKLEDERINIAWAEGNVSVDVAVLTTGRCPDRDQYPAPPEGSGALYLPNQVMTPEMEQIPLDATVHILGASLSAYDALNRLFSARTGCRFERSSDGKLAFRAGNNRRRVILCSRSGRLKAVQSLYPMHLKREVITASSLRASADDQGLSLEQVRRLIDGEAQRHGINLDWRQIIEPYAGCSSQSALTARAGELLKLAIQAATDPGQTNFLVDLFADTQFAVWDAFADQLLSSEAEATYRSRVETAALAYAAPCPVPTAEKLLALLESGQLEVRRGIREVSFDESRDGYVIEHDFGADLGAVLINATGMTYRDVDHPQQDPLTKNLAAQNLIRPYRRGGNALGGAEVDMNTFQLKGAANIYLANMLLWGPGFFTSSALTMAMVTERIVDHLLKRAAAK